MVEGEEDSWLVDIGVCECVGGARVMGRSRLDGVCVVCVGREEEGRKEGGKEGRKEGCVW